MCYNPKIVRMIETRVSLVKGATFPPIDLADGVIVSVYELEIPDITFFEVAVGALRIKD